METPAERAERIARLEVERAARRGGAQVDSGTVWPTPDDAGYGSVPVVAPGRGNLNYSSGQIPTIVTALSMVGPRTVSFARLFQSQPWVASAIMRMLTWAIRVPLRVFRRDEDPNNRIVVNPHEHALAQAITSPWNRAGQAQLVQAMLGPILVHGNSVIEVMSGAGDTIEFTPKDWRFVWPIMPWRGSLEGFYFDVDQEDFKRAVSIDEVLHTNWWSPTGPIGTSPLQQLGVTLQIEDAAQRYQRGLFANGARPPSAITMTEAFLSLDRSERKQILDQMRADVTAIYAGPENAGKPALLPPGLDWKELQGGTAVEAALIDQRKITREEVAAVYLIPPPLLGILDRATYSNIQVQRDMTYTDCLGPPLVLLEQAINSQVVRELLQDDEIFVEFDFAAVLRGDRLQEINALRDGVSSALFTPNEGRSVLGYPKHDDPAMDEFYAPTVNNLQAITGPDAELRRQQAAEMQSQLGEQVPGEQVPGDTQNPQNQPKGPSGRPQNFPQDSPKGRGGGGGSAHDLYIKTRSHGLTRKTVVR